MNFLKSIFAIVMFFGAVPQVVMAHEVYVLSNESVREGMEGASLNIAKIVTTHSADLVLWGFLVGFLIIAVFFLSISRRIEEKSNAFLVGIKRYAPLVVRVTLGLSFINAAFHGAFLAPELSFGALAGDNAGFFAVLLGLAGVLILVGLWVRIGALIGLTFFVLAVVHHGSYLFTYMDYLGGLLFLFLRGENESFFERIVHSAKVRPPFLHLVSDAVRKFGHEYGFLILRLGFGASLIYASYYGKYLHSGLALATVHDFGLEQVFGFDAEFIVLGALVLEMMLGIFFVFGFEIRFAVIVAATFLTLSQLYFKEAVWPHLVLFGFAIAIFMHGYDRYSFGGRFFRRGIQEPVL